MLAIDDTFLDEQSRVVETELAGQHFASTARGPDGGLTGFSLEMFLGQLDILRAKLKVAEAGVWRRVRGVELE